MLSPSPLSARARTIKGLRIDNLDGTVLGTIINAQAEKHLQILRSWRTQGGRA